MKRISYVIIGLLVLTSLLMFGFKNLKHTIYHTNSCERYNIDNIELRTGIDVPKVTEYDCRFDDSRRIKTSYFRFDEEKTDIDKYLSQYNFQKVENSKGFQILDTSKLYHDLTSDSDLYAVKQEKSTHAWEILFDKSTAKIWIAIRYRD